MDLLLQILEEGRLTDSSGRRVDFRNTVVILTSNLGADLIRKSTKVGFGQKYEGSMDYDTIKDKIEVAMKKHFKPEFINRLDSSVIFRPLNKGYLKEIIDIEVAKVQERLDKKDIYIELEDSAKEFLVEKGFQQEMGARPLRRVIEEYLEDSLAEKILKFPNEGRRCKVYEKENKLIFEDLEVFANKNRKKKEVKKAKEAIVK